MALGGQNAGAGLAFDGVSATGWIADFLAQLEGRAAFESFAARPMVPGHAAAVSSARVTRGWLFCGGGDWARAWRTIWDWAKRSRRLALIQHEWQATASAAGLLVCPTSVVGNWQKEAARFTPDLPVLVHHGTARSRGAAFARSRLQRHAIVVSSYSLLHRDFEIFRTDALGRRDARRGTEHQEPGDQTGQSRPLGSTPIAASRSPAPRWRTTSVICGRSWNFSIPVFLGSQSDSNAASSFPSRPSRDPEAAERLKRLTGPFILRRLKTDKAIIADLPEKQEMKVFCTLTKEQASLYAAVAKDATEALDQAEGIQRKGLVLATLSKLKQVCNHPASILRRSIRRSRADPANWRG